MWNQASLFYYWTIIYIWRNGVESELRINDHYQRFKQGICYKAQLNPALQNKQIDANYFQHVPYLESVSKEKGYSFVVAAVINTNFILDAKIDPKSALLRENANSPYANDLVVRN